jgi:hypothetical protein
MINTDTPPLSRIKSAVPLSLVLLTVSISLVNGLWFALDHPLLSQDEAGHILNAWRFQELFAQPDLLRPHWWKELLEVNRCYPPTTYIISGLLKLALGGSRAIDSGAMVLFAAILVVATFNICRLLNLGHRVRVLAPALLTLYPLTAVYTHSYYLDMQLAAAVACGLWAILWWQETAPTSGLKRAVIAGIVIGISCLVKHLVVIFIAGGALVIAGEYLRTNKISKSYCLSMAVLVLTALLIVLPWVVHNASFISGLTKDNLHYMQQTGQSTNFIEAALHYLRFLPESMSPLQFGSFMLALMFVDKKYHRILLPLTASALFGLAVTCSWNAATPINRYLTAALIGPSVYTALFLEQLFISKKIVARLLAGLILGLTLLQYTAFCFSPFPLSWLSSIPQLMGLSMQNPVTNLRQIGCPQPAEDWGYDMVAEKIVQTDGTKPVWLNVTINMSQLNTHGFELLTKEKGYSFKPTTSRMWTVSGDKIEFSPETTLYYDWFLVKSGYSGNHWIDSTSEQNYSSLIKYVRSSGAFQLVSSQDLPDGSKLELFRQARPLIRVP